MPLLDVYPNWASPVVERLQWSTDILQNRDGTEQRISLRSMPVYTFEYEFLLYKEALMKFKALIVKYQGALWDIPLWHNAYTMKQATSASSTALVVEAPEAYNFAVGGRALLVNSGSLYEIVDVVGITGTQLSISATAGSWPIGTRVIPLVRGYLHDTLTHKAITGQIESGFIQAKVVDYGSRPYMVPEMFNSKPILNSSHNWESPVQTQVVRDTEVIDYGTGPITVYDLYGYSQSLQTLEFIGTRDNKVNPVRALAEYCRGRWKSFYMPTNTADIEIIEDALSGQNRLAIANTEYASTIYERFPNQYIRVYLKNGVTYTLLVTQAVNVSTTREELVLSQNLSADIRVNDVYYISLLNLNRLESDALEFSWVTPEIVNVSASVRRVLE